MRDLETIKRLEHEAQIEYLRNLYTTLPEEPMTVFEFELEQAIQRDIADAKRELIRRHW